MWLISFYFTNCCCCWALITLDATKAWCFIEYTIKHCNCGKHWPNYLHHLLLKKKKKQNSFSNRFSGFDLFLKIIHTFFIHSFRLFPGNELTNLCVDIMKQFRNSLARSYRYRWLNRIFCSSCDDIYGFSERNESHILPDTVHANHRNHQQKWLENRQKRTKKKKKNERPTMAIT